MNKYDLQKYLQDCETYNLIQLPTDAEAIRQGCWFDPTVPKRFENFCRKWCSIESDDFAGSAGRPAELIDWQRRLAMTQFGWRRQVNGQDVYRFKRVFLYIPKRQGKSLYASLLGLFAALQSARAEVVILSPTIKQSKVIFGRMEDVIRSSPKLRPLFRLRPNINLIEQPKGQGEKYSIQILSAEGACSGFSLSCCIFDEFAEMPAHNVRLIYDRLYSSGSDRPNSQMIFTTTPQFDLSHLAHSCWLDCQQILQGKSQDIFTLPVCFNAPDNWRDMPLEDAVKIACPSVGITVPMTHYLDQQKVIEKNPLEESRFECLDLGRWTGSPEIWIPKTYLDNAITTTREDELSNHPCIFGLDYAASTDLCCASKIIEANGVYYVYPRYYLPELIAQEREKTDAVPYSAWQKDPLCNLTITSGDIVDTFAILETINKENQRQRIAEIRFDPKFLQGPAQLIQHAGYNCVEVNQSGYSMSPLFALMERLLREGKMKFPADPITLWCMSNARPKRKGDMLFVERSGQRNKIDFIDATCIGLSYFMQRDNNRPPAGARYCLTA